MYEYEPDSYPGFKMKMSQTTALTTKGKICWTIQQVIALIWKGNKLLCINKYKQIEDINMYYITK